MTQTERNQIRIFAADSENAIRAISKHPDRKERTALAAIAKIREIADADLQHP